MEIEHPVLKIFPTVEGRRLEIARLRALKEKIKVFLFHETAHQESLQIEKKNQESESKLIAELLWGAGATSIKRVFLFEEHVVLLFDFLTLPPLFFRGGFFLGMHF